MRARLPAPSIARLVAIAVAIAAAGAISAAVPATTRAAQPACTRHVNVDRSGNTDVTAELQRFINNSRNGSVICFAVDGRYRVNGTIHIQGRSHLVFRGRGATIFQTARTNSRIVLIDGGGTDIRLRNLTIRGANPAPGVWRPAYEHNHAIQIGGTAHVHLGYLRVRNVGGDALYIGAGRAGGSVRWASGLRLHHSLIDGTGRSGVSIADGGKHISIDHNTFRRIAFYTLNLEANGLVWNGIPAGARDVRFARNLLSTQPYGTGRGDQPVGHVFVVTGSSGGGPADGITLAGNRIRGRPFDVGVYNNGGLRRDIRVVRNHSDTRVRGPVMSFTGVRTLVVRDNRQPLSSGRLTSTSNCTNVLISGNVIR